MNPRAKRLLFVAEGATLAHVGRPLLLATAMAARGYEVTFAGPDRYRHWSPPNLPWRTLETQAPELFAARLASGRRLYREGRLASYIADDLNLIGEVRPDLVIGDFRLSLAASARTAGVPYAAIANAYWSPQRRLRPPAPVMVGAGALPAWTRRLLFRAAPQVAMRWQANPISAALARHGVMVGGDLRKVFTEADVTLYADHPGLFPAVVASDREVFLGPLAWSPDGPLPAWWNDVPRDRPLAYLTLGSSGVGGEGATMILEALAAEGYSVIMATAGRVAPADHPGVFAADFLPGDAACARAELIVCNGGSPAVNQAIVAGLPVLGVCSNLDQMLNMRAAQSRGIGLMLRSDGLSRDRLRGALRRLREERFVATAGTMRTEATALDPAEILATVISRLTSA